MNDNPAELCDSTRAADGRSRISLQKLWAFVAEEDGPTAVEYAVMLSLIVAVCLSAITTVGSNASRAFSKVASSIH